MSGERPTVVVTRKLPTTVEEAIASRYDARFNRTDVSLSPEQMSQVLRTTDIVLCTVTDKLRAELFEGPVKTRLLANFGVGVNHIDRDAARRAGVQISNTPDVLTDDTADLALALLLMTMRRLGEGERHLRSGAWSGWRPTHLMGHSPHGKTLGIIGYGRIGRALARQVSSALGMHVIWYAPRDPRIDDPATAGPATAERVASVDVLLERADVVSLHCPATPETRHLINAERLARMGPKSYLINTARGDIVDDESLIAALQSGRLAAAGLDVFKGEPLIDPRYRSLDNVFLLPHIGSATPGTRSAMGHKCLDNLSQFFGGQRPTDLLTGD